MTRCGGSGSLCLQYNPYRAAVAVAVKAEKVVNTLLGAGISPTHTFPNGEGTGEMNTHYLRSRDLAETAAVRHP